MCYKYATQVKPQNLVLCHRNLYIKCCRGLVSVYVWMCKMKYVLQEVIVNKIVDEVGYL